MGISRGRKPQRTGFAPAFVSGTLLREAAGANEAQVLPIETFCHVGVIRAPLESAHEDAAEDHFTAVDIDWWHSPFSRNFDTAGGRRVGDR